MSWCGNEFLRFHQIVLSVPYPFCQQKKRVYDTLDLPFLLILSIWGSFSERLSRSTCIELNVKNSHELSLVIVKCKRVC